MSTPFRQDSDILELVHLYSPYFQFSERERYLPASFQHICEHAPLSYDGNKVKGASVDKIRESVSNEMQGIPPTLGHHLVWKGDDDSGDHGRDDKLCFDIGVVHKNSIYDLGKSLLTGSTFNDGYAGAPDPSNKLYGDPMAKRRYLNAHIMGRFTCEETGIEMVDIIYCVYFMFNGTIESHAFDIEYAVLRFQYYDPAHVFGYHTIEPMVVPQSKSMWHLVRIYLSAHGNGVWYPTRFPGETVTTLDFMDGTHPVIFSANASHALYPSAKRNKRFMGFADDVTEGNGILWRATHLVVWGPAMFPIGPTSRVQERPSVDVLCVTDGTSVEPDPLIYLNFFRGKFGAVQGTGCPGCQSTFPFKEAINMLTSGDGYYKFQKGGIQSVISVGTSPFLRTGVHVLNIGCIVAALSLIFLVQRKLGKGKSDEALVLVRLMWIPVIVGLFSSPVNSLIRFS